MKVLLASRGTKSINFVSQYLKLAARDAGNEEQNNNRSLYLIILTEELRAQPHKVFKKPLFLGSKEKRNSFCKKFTIHYKIRFRV